MGLKAFVVYCSPSGSTRQIGQVIQAKLAELGVTDVVSADIGRENAAAPLVEQINNATEPVALFIGTPVYASVPVPPVMQFIERLQQNTESGQRFAIPFAIWGMVTSGQALWYMGQALLDKGFVLAGGITTIAQHSLHWYGSESLGYGHPSPEDEAPIGTLLEDLVPRLQNGTVKPFPLDAIDDYPEPPTESWDSRFDNLRDALPSKVVNETLCTRCDTCQDECPVAAITLAPYPVIDMTTCIVCHNCVRLCPEGAMQADMSGSGFTRIPQMSAESRVPKQTRIFFTA